MESLVEDRDETVRFFVSIWNDFSWDSTPALEREPFSMGYPVYPRAFICPVCLKHWATIVSKDGEIYQIEATPCKNHPRGCGEILYPVAGSLLDNSVMNGVDWGLLEVLPPDLVKREFELHLRSYETGEPIRPGNIEQSMALYHKSISQET